MSFNIDNWETKSLVNFSIPLEHIKNSEYFNEIDILPDSNKIEVYGDVEGFELTGTLNDENVMVNEIYYWGGGSGSYWDDFLLFLSKSSGQLEAIQMWESGYKITRLIVNDGIITKEPVDL